MIKLFKYQLLQIFESFKQFIIQNISKLKYLVKQRVFDDIYFEESDDE